MLIVKGYSASTINLQNFNSQNIINRYVSYHSDVDKQYGILEVLGADSLFLSSKKGVLNFGYFDDYVWLKFNITSSKPEDLLLEITPVWIDTFQLFCVSKGEIIYQSSPTGIDFKDDRIRGRQTFPYFDEHNCNFMIPLKVDAGSNSIYIKTCSKYFAKRMSLKLWQKEQFENRTIPIFELLSTRYIILGIALFAVIIGFALGVFLNQKIFALYGFFLLSTLLNLFAMKGWIYPYIDFF